MKFVKKEKDSKGRDVIVCEKQFRYFFGFKKKNVKFRFLAQSVIIKDKYWKWLSMPELSLVGDSVSFQLDAWNKEY